MAINLISPGIKITETDQPPVLSSISGQTTGGVVGRFRWGPVSKAVLVGSESELIENFGKPNSTNAVDFLGASNFLSYAPNLYVVRVEQTNALNSTAEATTGSGTTGTGLLVKNDDVYEGNYLNGAGNVGPWIAKFPGALGNSIRVSTCASANAWQSTLTGTWSVTAGASTLTSANGDATSEVNVGDLLVVGSRVIKVSSVTDANTIVLADSHITGETGVTVTRRWEFFNNFNSAPGTSTYTEARGGSGDEMHIAVVDAGGEITGVAGTLLEKFAEVSKAADAKSDTGGSTYYKEVIRNNSKYIRWMDHDQAGTNWGGNATGVTFTSPEAPKAYRLAGGVDGDNPTDTQKIAGYQVFANKSNISVDLIPMGVASATVINTVVVDIAEQRRDVMLLVSPRQADVVNAAGSEVTNILNFVGTLTKSTYVAVDSNWKYQYDKFNDTYVYVPCNYDVAGIMARTDINRSPWNSPAGYNNGVLLNVTKLAFNPNEAQRDALYKESVNPIFSQVGRGTVLFGDKTFIGKNTSFNRINVRRLFIELQNTIGEFAGNVLFEDNTEATRTSFVNTIEPYLRNVQARRGIVDFLVVCDDTNNPESVVSANEFVCDIFVRPVSSINFIQLNFVSVRGAVSFSELQG
jgi:hypothetical protein